MSTGVDSFTNPQNIEALYPFAGVEVLYAILGILLWLAWHVRQTMIENREYERAIELYERVGMSRALQQGGTEWLPDEEELSAVSAVAAGASAPDGAQPGQPHHVGEKQAGPKS
jgi:hypothetical protein